MMFLVVEGEGVGGVICIFFLYGLLCMYVSDFFVGYVYGVLNKVCLVSVFCLIFFCKCYILWFIYVMILFECCVCVWLCF